MAGKFKRGQRVTIVLAVALIVVSGAVLSEVRKPAPMQAQTYTDNLALSALDKLAVRNPASMAGYNRGQFANDWATVGNCDMREQILNRDLVSIKDESATDCTVLLGTLHDPYTGKTIQFKRGAGTSSAVQIDHVVALSDAWQTGAQQLPTSQRQQLYNDPLELIAVDGATNDAKGGSDAAGWLPPNKPYDCRYVARQIAVKTKYHLWITPAEHVAMQHALASCPSQVLPIGS